MGARHGRQSGRSGLAHRQRTTGPVTDETAGVPADAPVDDRVPREALLGRDQLLARLEVTVSRARAGQRATVLVAGPAGIGKTTLVRAAASAAAANGARVGWGTCVDGAGGPGYWPWTQVLNGFVRALGTDKGRALAGEDAPLLAAIAPGFGDRAPEQASDRTRLLLLDATARWLDTLAAESPLVIVVDDLQWADQSSLALFDFVARAPQPAPVCVIGAYRDDELTGTAKERIARLVAHADHVQVAGLDLDAVQALVEGVTHRPVERAEAERVHHRTGGHPMFVREVALLSQRAASHSDDIPAAVRDAIERRVRSLPAPTRSLLEVAAVAGAPLRPDVAASVLDLSPLDVEAAVRPAIAATVVVLAAEGLHFTHDLQRETIFDGIGPQRRARLHQAIGTALEDRMSRAGDVAASELARHFSAALPLDGPDRAVKWALAAAAADRARSAFAEAATHLRRLRAAVADGGGVLPDRQLLDVLVAEADALARGGSPLDARGLLRRARDVAERAGEPAGVARVALATAELGAQFASRRDEIIHQLATALEMAAGTDPAVEARLTSALARELQHSIAEDRPRAGPLSERALELGRLAGDSTTLAACLLARHDVLWGPGDEVERADVAREIVAVARQAGDDERHAEGLLLLANALLAQGSSAFEAAMESSLDLFDRLDQLRFRYTAESRRACLALLRGRLDEAGDRIERAAGLGGRIREPDTGNVRMSQRLELVRARNDPDELRVFAAEAVAHWTGAPIHAHAVAAGFLSRAGDVDAAQPHIAAVVDLGGWRADRSYLWSVFTRELAAAAVALADQGLCQQLLDDLEPLSASCGVNGAMIAFAGSHAHTAGMLAAGLGQVPRARDLLTQACAVYGRLGATDWLADARRALGPAAGQSRPGAGPTMQRQGDLWRVAYRGQQAIVAHVKGLADIARLVAAPGTDVHVLDLADAADRSGSAGAMADRQALEAYRRRLADLDEDIAEASLHRDDGRTARHQAERQALLDELGRVAGTAHRARQFANHPAERARKAITARVRDAIRKLEPELPELAAHLDRSIVTGTYCRYRGDDAGA